MTRMPSLPPAGRRHLFDLPDVAHGALDFAEVERLKLDAEAVLDFSTNTNPYGPPPAVRQAILQAVQGKGVERYPDRQALALRRALARQIGGAFDDIDCILPANGVSELIWLVALAFLEAGDNVLIIGPTFGEYANAVRIQGARVETWLATEECAFEPDPAAIAQQLAKEPYRLVFLCNPNNPTGKLAPLDQIAAWAEQYPHTVFVIDEAYLAFSPGMPSCIELNLPNILALRSMTKDFALAGLRLGYAVGHARLVALLRKVQPPWSVNHLAQVAGVAAVQDIPYLQETLHLLQAHMVELVRGLENLGYPVVDSKVNFFLVQVGNGAGFRAALARRGILVRDCASFGLPAYIRIAARTPPENARLLDMITEGMK